jgi:prepilin-type processing-associated H-X9-DG protein
MKQLGLAVQLYENSFRIYPPANVVLPRRHNLLTFVLPFVEQRGLADQYDWSFDWDAPANRGAIEHEVPEFRCPSAPPTGTYTADYAACTNLISPARSALLDSGQVAPRSSWLSALQPARSTTTMIRDGLSHSLLLFEDGGRPARYIGPTRQSGTTSGAAWADAEGAFEIHHLCRGTSLMNCRNDNEIYSFHVQGCNFVFADGAVRFLVQDLDPDLFVALFTREAADVADRGGR